MSAVPKGWEIGARLRADIQGGTEGTIVFLADGFAVLDINGVDNALAYYIDPCWSLVSPFPPIPEDVGTIVLRRGTLWLLALRGDDGWYRDGQRVFGWKPDPAGWQQLIPKEQQ